jgi:thioredoxin 1
MLNLLLRLFLVLFLLGGIELLFIWWRKPDMQALKDVHIFEGVGLLMFSADWCGPCKSTKAVLKPMLEDELKDIEYQEVNVDTHPEFAKKYGIKSIPTMILFDGDDILKVSNRLEDILNEIRGLAS